MVIMISSLPVPRLPFVLQPTICRLSRRPLPPHSHIFGLLTVVALGACEPSDFFHVELFKEYTSKPGLGRRAEVMCDHSTPLFTSLPCHFTADGKVVEAVSHCQERGGHDVVLGGWHVMTVSRCQFARRANSTNIWRFRFSIFRNAGSILRMQE